MRLVVLLAFAFLLAAPAAATQNNDVQSWLCPERVEGGGGVPDPDCPTDDTGFPASYEVSLTNGDQVIVRLHHRGSDFWPGFNQTQCYYTAEITFDWRYYRLESCATFLANTSAVLCDEPSPGVARIRQASFAPGLDMLADLPERRIVGAFRFEALQVAPAVSLTTLAEGAGRFFGNSDVEWWHDSGTGCNEVVRDEQNNSALLTTTQQCANGLDDDGDGKIDHPTDPQCSNPADGKENPTSSCGLGFEAGFAVLAWAAARRYPRSRLRRTPLPSRQGDSQNG